LHGGGRPGRLVPGFPMSDPTDDLLAELAQELDRLPPENAARLAGILRGLFACMSDLNQRVALLEVRPLAFADIPLAN
jgi:hypothetical protein